MIGTGMGRLLYEEMLDPAHFKTLKARKFINEKDKGLNQKETT